VLLQLLQLLVGLAGLVVGLVVGLVAVWSSAAAAVACA
jgi:hypothetical protein